MTRATPEEVMRSWGIAPTSIERRPGPRWDSPPVFTVRRVGRTVAIVIAVRLRWLGYFCQIETSREDPACADISWRWSAQFAVRAGLTTQRRHRPVWP